MKLRSLLLLLVLVAIAGFAALNWAVFTAPTALSLGVTDVQAPLGLIMLGTLVLVLVLALAYVLYLQTTVMLDARGHAKELQANRKLADQAEASRFTELRAFLDLALKSRAAADQESQRVMLARLDLLERELRLAIEQSGNSVAASLGEIDDRLRTHLLARQP